MREKLIELLRNNYGEFMMYTKHHKSPLIFMTSMDNLADFLIENGVEIPVRCEECAHSERYAESRNLYECKVDKMIMRKNDYCSYGEPKEKGEE